MTGYAFIESSESTGESGSVPIYVGGNVARAEASRDLLVRRCGVKGRARHSRAATSNRDFKAATGIGARPEVTGGKVPVERSLPKRHVQQDRSLATTVICW